jgi:hypothetical protein
MSKIGEFMKEQTAMEQVMAWPSDRLEHAQKRLFQIAKQAVSTSVPNLINEEEAADIALMIRSYEEEDTETEVVQEEEMEVATTEGESSSEVVD